MTTEPRSVMRREVLIQLLMYKRLITLLVPGGHIGYPKLKHLFNILLSLECSSLECMRATSYLHNGMYLIQTVMLEHVDMVPMII